MTSNTPSNSVPVPIATGKLLHKSETSVRRWVKGLEAPVTTWITLTLPLDQEGCARAGCFEPTGLLTTDEIQHFHRAVSHENPRTVDNRALWFGSLYHITASAVPLIAIDPDTGDSVLHTGVRAGRLDNLSAVQRLYTRNPQDYIPGCFLPRHKNHAGETIMHVAARDGDLIMVIAAYRLLARHGLPSRGDEVDNSSHGDAGGAFGPVEYRDEYHDADEHLVFLTSRNNSGQDAAAVARESGHERVAQWIEALVMRRDPKGIRNDHLAMAELVKEVHESQYFEYIQIPSRSPEEDEDDNDDESEYEDEDERENESERATEEGKN